MAATPHLTVPFHLAGAAFAVVEQDSGTEIDQCIEAVLRTPEGTRVDAPGFGRPDTSFAQLGAAPSSQPYIAAVEQWEPRAELVGDARLDGLTEKITIAEEP